MAKIVIIGAGLTGISTAYHLEKQQFFDYTLFEKEAEFGGLCRSIIQDGFTFDYTGHLLHAKDPYFYSLIQQVIGIEQLNTIARRSFIYFKNKYSGYPFQVNLYGFPPKTVVECITGFLNRTPIEHPQTFAQWVLANFGTGLAHHFFFPYQRKIFSYNVNRLTASWTQRFVPSTSIEQMLYGALSDSSKNQSIGYNARFFYPKRGGIITWVKQLAKQITNPIATSCRVRSVDMNKKTVSFENGHTQPYEILISTMPLDHLLDCLVEKTSLNLKAARQHLLCNKVVNFNIGLNHTQLPKDKNWGYFPEKKYPFYRIGFWHSFSDAMTPPGCSSLYGEFSYMHKSRRWINHALKKSLIITKKLYSIAPADIATEKVITIPHAYVTYDQWREKNLPRILQQLEDNGIYSIGRYGAWKYTSMQEAVLDGKQAADTCIKTVGGTPFLHTTPAKQREIS